MASTILSSNHSIMVEPMLPDLRSWVQTPTGAGFFSLSLLSLVCPKTGLSRNFNTTDFPQNVLRSIKMGKTTFVVMIATFGRMRLSGLV